MQWLKKISQQSIESILIGVISGNTDINVAKKQIAIIGVDSCNQIQTMISTMPNYASILTQLAQAAGCNEQSEIFTDSLNINNPNNTETI